ncbi:lachesin isoform X2 [Eurytemora carolleeae]|uniref:lachesin isoform X2 n=1 Tax=Eurytemora carolleeae TaxID=1294199 RepID=UPI000C759386|nr:lachesin isoform X2 [Eurytemora carolleeae]|eukprot:XP_023337368.1 lachesin-like isoform X2 [Eurytemora affinis]
MPRCFLIQSFVTANILAGINPGLGVYQHIRNTASFSSIKPELGAESTNITAVIGQTTHLHCIVKHIGDRTVSWIRKGDLHVLTSGAHTFTGDRRFSSLHSDSSDSWSLQIRYTQLKDEGEYHCQINTEPKMSLPIFLSVEEAKAEIQDKDQDLFVKKGSRLELRCLVNKGEGVHESMAVFWYLNSRVLDWMGQTGPGFGAKVLEKNGEMFESILRISRSRMEHDGLYITGSVYQEWSITDSILQDQ